MKQRAAFGCALAALVWASVCATPVRAGDVAIYTGQTSWLVKDLADVEAQITADRLSLAGVTVDLYTDPAQEAALADWVTSHTGNGEVDVLILYGFLPSTIYPSGNSMPDGSIAELFIESTDGDAIINHADWMFYVTTAPLNGAAGLQNIMDIPGVTMAGNDNVPMAVTPEGLEIAPNLVDAETDRPLHLNTLTGEWVVEAALSRGANTDLADPVIVRDGNRGRIIPIYQAADQNDNKGAVAADVVSWLLDAPIEPASIGIFAPATTSVTGTRTKLQIALLDDFGYRVNALSDVTVNLSSDSGGGVFDTAFGGSFNGSVTSVVIPAGQSAVDVYYRDSEDGVATVTGSAGGLGSGAIMLNILDDLSGEQGDVAIFTGGVGWIAKADADAQAQIALSRLTSLGVNATWFSQLTDDVMVADWVLERTDNGKVDVLVLYGYLPATLYAPPNLEPDGSLAELFIESTDGDVIINHADWMFYVSSQNNGEMGLQNIMDHPGLLLWGDNTPVTVTPEGAAVSPTIQSFASDRPFRLNELQGEWFVELAVAQNLSGTRADPVVLRDGNRGRLIPIYHTNNQNDPKGSVSAEIIAYLYGIELPMPAQLGILGQAASFTDTVQRLTIQLQDDAGDASTSGVATTINLSSSSASGRFDVSATGAFDGSITSVVIPPSQSSVTVFYRDTTAGTATITASAAGLDNGQIQSRVFARSIAPPGEVAVFSGLVNWIAKDLADTQAQITVDLLNDAGIPTMWFGQPTDDAALADWMEVATNNGEFDVVVLYGHFPDAIYPSPNVMPDGSIAEAFIESPDGDMIINHGDWMFYVSAQINGPAGLNNMMDLPGVQLGPDNTQMVVTDVGREYSPSLVNFLSDRPLHLNTLGGDWLVEAALATNGDGTLADPVIVRDGNRGRLAPMLQAADQNDPKGVVAAEVIAHMMGSSIAASTVGADGPTTFTTGTAVRYRLSPQDAAGLTRALDEDVEIELATSSGTGAFDTSWGGAFNGSVGSVTIPAGALYVDVYYKDSSAGAATLTLTPEAASGLEAQDIAVNVLQDLSGGPGEVLVFTGAVNPDWITKANADAQAQIMVDALGDLGIPVTWHSDPIAEQDVADWVLDKTDNGEVDVLVLYGYFPPTIYGAGNAEPDGSLAELFIESTDGDVIMNHADYMFYFSNPNNDVAGLQNMMDIPTIAMWDDNTQVRVTEAGMAIAPSLGDYVTDRPFHVNELAGEWFVEASLAENDAGTRADPIIVRDGNRGRLIPAFQTQAQDDPKGQVAAEIIAWLFDGGSPAGPVFLRGDADASGALNLTDGIRILSYLFVGQVEIICLDSADADDSGGLNLTDGIFVLNYLFVGESSPPPAPFPGCGVDPTEDTTSCEQSQPNCL